MTGVAERWIEEGYVAHPQRGETSALCLLDQLDVIAHCGDGAVETFQRGDQTNGHRASAECPVQATMVGPRAGVFHCDVYVGVITHAPRLYFDVDVKVKSKRIRSV